jgi:hypothetical protein
MMIKAEIYQDFALLLDAQGRIWKFKIGYDNRPEVQELMTQLSREMVNQIMEPSLVRYLK